MIKLYKNGKDDDGKEVVETCNCDRDQRSVMLKAGWRTTEKIKSKKKAKEKSTENKDSVKKKPKQTIKDKAAAKNKTEGK